MSKWNRKNRVPSGYEYIQPVMDALEKELREKMNEPHDGKRQCEALCPNYNYGTVSICRVPRQQLSEGQVIQEKHSGCRGCASGPGGYHNIFGNKYGQYLARIQIAREEKEKKEKQVWATEQEDYEYVSHQEGEEEKKKDRGKKPRMRAKRVKRVKRVKGVARVGVKRTSPKSWMLRSKK
ncbi:hypothetical protein PsorP6_012872 [Peronosclerospora sorghi]|uniref:Uncharacterized protein n=1 Tax=Peronosclerospora sorghi TaxID=230839 RepID=A0ACC0WGU9_9STRA|nr:hypothetical protein PsorP6_012872 [Peronosclerospora sorghi]